MLSCYLTLMFNNSTNSFILAPNPLSFPLLRELQERFLYTAVAPGFHTSRFGHSLRVPDSSTCRCMLHRGDNQYARGSERLLEGFSVGYLDGVVHGYFASKSVDNLTFNSFIETNAEQAALSSLPPVASVKPLKSEPQEPVATKAVKYKATERFDAGASVPITRQEVRASGTGNASLARHAVSGKDKMSRSTSQARHVKPYKGRTRRVKCQAKTTVSGQGQSSRTNPLAKCQGSDKGKEVRGEYFTSDKFKTNLAKSAASVKVKAAQARYNASQKCKITRARYAASDEGKAARAKYVTSDKGKLSQAIRTAKLRAYQSALRNGFSEELAREKAQAVADKKRAELSLTKPL